MNRNPLITRNSYFPSYGRKSLLSARDLLHQGSHVRLDSENSVAVWQDPWIPIFFLGRQEVRKCFAS